MKSGSDNHRSIQISDEDIFQEIYTAIVEQKMHPGMKLTEDALGEIFKVSRTRIRKILFRLESHGIIVIESNRGAFVAKPTAKEAKQVFEARRILEDGVVRRACSMISASQIKLLQKHIKAEKQAFLKQDRAAIIRLAGQFHLEVAQIIQNDVLLGFLKQLLSKQSLIISVFQQTGDTLCMTDEHQFLLDTIVAGDEEKAASLMKTHLDHLEASFQLDSDDDSEVSLADIFQGVLSKFGK